MRTPSIENYLKAIYQLEEQGQGAAVATTDLADFLGVAPASVTAMIKRISTEEHQLATYTPYAGVSLTEKGRRAALEVIRHHRLLESYLTQALGYSWDEVHEEAERLEHVISEQMEERMASALGHPLTDPHGDPIPDREGNMPQVETIPLAQLPEGQCAVVQRITGQEPELLRYLAEVGLTPAAQIRVISKAPFNGPLHLTLECEPEQVLALGREVSEKILVQAATNNETEHNE